MTLQPPRTVDLFVSGRWQPPRAGQYEPATSPVTGELIGHVAQGDRADAGAASGMLQTMQQTGGALGVASLTSIAAVHGRSDALLVGTGIIVVAFLVAYVAVRPARSNVPATAEESAQEMIPLLLSE